MPGRTYTATSSYRYGFNGKENDNEVKGEGNQQDYGMRIYDPRLGRFLSVDPLTKNYPMLTPYQFASNRPIDGIDLDGGEWFTYWHYMAIKNKGKPTQKQPAKSETEKHVGINFSSALIPKQQYSPSTGSWMADLMFNGDKIAHNASANVWNGAVQLTEDVSNLAFSAEGRKAVNEKIGNAAYNGFRTAVDISKKSPDQIINEGINYLKTPEGAEAALTFGYSALLSEVMPAIRFPKLGLKADLPPGTQTMGFSFSRSVLGKTPFAPNKLSTGCEALASSVQKSIGGEFLQITPKAPALQLGEVNYAGGQVSGWYHHVAVLKDGMVYDGLTGSAGMALDQYKAMFKHADVINFTPSKTITVK